MSERWAGQVSDGSKRSGLRNWDRITSQYAEEATGRIWI